VKDGVQDGSRKCGEVRNWLPLRDSQALQTKGIRLFSTSIPKPFPAHEITILTAVFPVDYFYSGVLTISGGLARRFGNKLLPPIRPFVQLILLHEPNRDLRREFC
jgi:hypothetical protein